MLRVCPYRGAGRGPTVAARVHCRVATLSSHITCREYKYSKGKENHHVRDQSKHILHQKLRVNQLLIKSRKKHTNECIPNKYSRMSQSRTRSIPRGTDIIRSHTPYIINLSVPALPCESGEYQNLSQTDHFSVYP